MTRVKVTRKYQVTIPLEIRRRIGLSVGDNLEVKEEGRKIVMERRGDLLSLAGSWEDIDDTDLFLRDVREVWKTWKQKPS